jgi:hypothetical protein
MIIIGDYREEISRLQGQLVGESEMKNLGRLKYFLGIEIARSSKHLSMPKKIFIRCII